MVLKAALRSRKRRMLEGARVRGEEFVGDF